MNTTVFVSYCLALTTLMTVFYGEARQYFNRPDPYIHRIENLKEDVESQKLKTLMTQSEFEDFRQYVATLLPGVIHEKGPGEKSYQYRTLASVVSKDSSDDFGNMKARQLFDKGKKYFREHQYDLAAQTFADVIGKHAYSAYVVEAMFLQLESNFQMRHFDECIAVMNKMLDLYPSSELTGYAMLRVGKIYEFNDRHDQAIQLYQTVLQAFPQRDLASLASQSLKAVQL